MKRITEQVTYHNPKKMLFKQPGNRGKSPPVPATPDIVNQSFISHKRTRETEEESTATEESERDQQQQQQQEDFIPAKFRRLMDKEEDCNSNNTEVVTFKLEGGLTFTLDKNMLSKYPDSLLYKQQQSDQICEEWDNVDATLFGCLVHFYHTDCIVIPEGFTVTQIRDFFSKFCIPFKHESLAKCIPISRLSEVCAEICNDVIKERLDRYIQQRIVPEMLQSALTGTTSISILYSSLEKDLNQKREWINERFLPYVCGKTGLTSKVHQNGVTFHVSMAHLDKKLY